VPNTANEPEGKLDVRFGETAGASGRASDSAERDTGKSPAGDRGAGDAAGAAAGGRGLVAEAAGASVPARTAPPGGANRSIISTIARLAAEASEVQLAASLVTVREPSELPSELRISILARHVLSLLDTATSMEKEAGEKKTERPRRWVTSASRWLASGHKLAESDRTQER